MTKRRAASLPLLLAALGAAGCPAREAPRPGEEKAAARSGPSPEERDALYALGGWLARNLAGVKIREEDLAPIEEGLADALLGRPLRVEPKDVAPRVKKLLTERRGELADEEKAASAPLIATARQQPGAERTASGLVFQSLVEGEGEAPALNERVEVEYRGTLRDGTLFDSTEERGAATFELTKVVPCWSEALRRMKPGGRAVITCPSDLAYGDRGLPGRVLPGAALRFEITLLRVLPAKAAAAEPASAP